MKVVLLRSNVNALLDELDIFVDEARSEDVATMLGMDDGSVPGSAVPAAGSVAAAVGESVWRPYARGTPSKIAEAMYFIFFHRHVESGSLELGFCQGCSMRAADTVVRGMSGLDRQGQDALMCEDVEASPATRVTVEDDVEDEPED